MATIKQSAWQPVSNKSGRNMGTFDGIYDEVGQTRDGKEFEYTEAIFKVRGSDGEKEVTQDVSIRISDKYSPRNNIGKLAKALGFEYREETKEDEFGMLIPSSNNLDELATIFDRAEGQVFMFKTRATDRGIWEIIVETIKPLKVQTK